MISSAIGTIGAIIGVIGWFGFGSVLALVIGLVAYLIETFIEWDRLNRNAKATDLFVFALGCIVGLMVENIPFYVMGLIFINIYSLATGIMGAFYLFGRH